MKPRALLVDSASLYFRAFYGRGGPSAPPESALAVRGFLDMLTTLLRAAPTSHLVCCWDEDWRPAFRVAAIPSYKAHRLASGSSKAEDVPAALAAQVPLIVEVLAALGIPRVGAGGYEADDIIATLAAGWRGTLTVDIVTGDRDLFQLVDDRSGVRVLYPVRGGIRAPAVITQEYLQRTYGVPDGHRYAELAILRGDPSDGLPGVSGIGEKGAAKLLAEYGSLAGIRAAAEDPRSKVTPRLRSSIQQAAPYLDQAPRVVFTATDAPLPDTDLRLPTQVADPVRLADLAQRHQLSGPIQRLQQALFG